MRAAPRARDRHVSRWRRRRDCRIRLCGDPGGTRILQPRRPHVHTSTRPHVRVSARPTSRLQKTSGSAHRRPHLLQPRRARRPASGGDGARESPARAARSGGSCGRARRQQSGVRAVPDARLLTCRPARDTVATRARRGTWARGRRGWWRMAWSRRRSPGRRPAPGRPSEHRAATPSTPVRAQGRPEPRTRSVTACRTWRSSSACSRRASSP